jgi:hypothetical protein
VLSDGFDYNLDRLQALHGVRFEYDANHLHYEDGAWRIEARHPNPACECGTGTCKRLRIEQFRGSHPALTIVHIGNGRVSMCAARWRPMSPSRRIRSRSLSLNGHRDQPFETLRDVIPHLARLLAEARA